MPEPRTYTREEVIFLMLGARMTTYRPKESAEHIATVMPVIALTAPYAVDLVEGLLDAYEAVRTTTEPTIRRPKPPCSSPQPIGI